MLAAPPRPGVPATGAGDGAAAAPAAASTKDGRLVSIAVTHPLPQSAARQGTPSCEGGRGATANDRRAVELLRMTAGQ